MTSLAASCWLTTMPPARQALRLILETQGHTVQEADDGLDGIRAALTWKPDVALVDIEMPIFDGYGFARRVREKLGFGMCLIALTGHDHPGRALAAGFDEHLLKPADPERICLLVREAA
jgi:CheY-like chemotaxis protein